MEYYLFATRFRPVVRPTQPPTKRRPESLMPGVKRPERETDHSSLLPRLIMCGDKLHSPIRLQGIVLN
jgi:hypothetical protein